MSGTGSGMGMIVWFSMWFFPPGGEKLPATTSNGYRPYALVLLPYLREDLEEYATREALLALEHRDDLEKSVALLATSVAERRRILLERTRCYSLRDGVSASGGKIRLTPSAGA